MRPMMHDTPSIVQDQSNEEPCAPAKTFPKILPKASTRSLVGGADPVKAAAVAAGARIATPSAAAAILKQQLKSAIHIKTNGSSFRDLHSPNPVSSQETSGKIKGEQDDTSEKGVVMGIRENEKEL